MAALVGLEARTVDTVDDGDVVEEHVGDVVDRRRRGAERPDTHPVRLVPDRRRLEQNIMRAVGHSNGVVAVVDHRVLDDHVLSGDVEAVGVEGEAAGRGVGVDDGVRDGDVAARQIDIPADGLGGLEVRHDEIVDAHGHEVGARDEAGARVGVGVPPGLAVGVDPSAGDVAGAEPS